MDHFTCVSFPSLAEVDLSCTHTTVTCPQGIMCWSIEDVGVITYSHCDSVLVKCAWAMCMYAYVCTSQCTYYTVHLLHGTPTTRYTYYTVHLLHSTPTTQYTYYTVYLLHNTPTTQYTYYTIHLLHSTPTTQYRKGNVHLLHSTPTTQYTYYTVYPLHTAPICPTQ